MGNHTVRSHNGVVANGYTLENNGVLAKPAIVFDAYRLRDEFTILSNGYATGFDHVVGIGDQNI